MITAKEFQEQFLNEDDEISLPETSCVDVGEDIVDSKMVYNSNVYLHEGQYFEVMWARSNSGYWGDSESFDTEVFEVEPFEVTKTEYRIKKEQKQDAN